MNTCVGLVGKVLETSLESTGVGHVEDGSVSGVIIEWVAVDAVRGFLRCK